MDTGFAFHYSQTMLECHTLSTTNIGIKAGVAVNQNFFFTQNISNTLPTDGLMGLPDKKEK
jgi:hypothetical protein